MAKKIFREQKDLNSALDILEREPDKLKIAGFHNLVIKIPDNITAEVGEGKNGFLFDSNSGRVYALNKTASFVFSKIKDGLSLSEIVKALTARYDVDEGVAVSDIEDLLYQLREFNIAQEQ